jgi:DNA-binding beta-propeller fold protein YncE
MGRVLFSVFLLATLGISGSRTPRSHGLLLVANKEDHTLGIIDPDAGRQIATIPEGGVTGHEVAASPEGKLAFVPIYGDSEVWLPGTDGSQIAVINIGERRLAQTIEFGHAVRPHGAVFGPKDGLLYVTTELDNSVAIFDPHAKIPGMSANEQVASSDRVAMIGSIPTEQDYSHMLAISPDGNYGYTANVAPGTVSVLDLKARKTLAVIPVATHVQRISISSNGSWVFTSDTTQPRLAVINAETKKVDRWIALPGTGYGSASTPDGKWLLVAMPDTNAVAVIDLPRMSVAKTVTVPPSPQEVLIRPDGKVAYVSCDRSAKVAAVQLTNWSVKLIDAGPGADGLAWVR